MLLKKWKFLGVGKYLSIFYPISNWMLQQNIRLQNHNYYRAVQKLTIGTIRYVVRNKDGILEWRSKFGILKLKIIYQI